MRLKGSMISSSMLIAIVLLMFCGVAAAEAVKTDIEQIKERLEKSSLSDDKKNSLLNRASSAVKIGVPAADMVVIIKRGLDRNIGSKTMEDFIDIAVRAREQHLPVRPVLDRVQQGLAKGVPPEKISAFTERLVEKLAAAGKLIISIEKGGIRADKEKYREEGMHTIARALEKAVPADMITKIGLKVASKSGSFSTFNASINTLATFVEGGIQPEQASRLVQRGLDKGYSASEMIGMEMEMSRMMREGRMMDDAVRSMEKMMSSGSIGDMQKGMGPGSMSTPGGTGMGGSSSIPTTPGGMHRGGPGMGHR